MTNKQNARRFDGGRSQVSFAAERHEDNRKGETAQPLALLIPSKADADQLIGADPRNLTAAHFGAADVAILGPAAAIRAKCLDCSGGSSAEVRKCVAVNCALWPHRMGVLPRALRAGVRGRRKRPIGFWAERSSDSTQDGPCGAPGLPPTRSG
jgi:hypothetical protein